ncbi:hypothetical protein OP10G_0427 [Fimbriimonas ginsengisoli Gsoil 348]|uniref:Uncharacterized protein n=1 Tax=Fimbriimonas ginsengisoli Gsoil 348 TaxID=661478 RepID=A0A068NLY6_FIMGI|nr:hypothetical protein OP10G_0427 [Fimbriimonas ginsengisoli Gsoil 348]
MAIGTGARFGMTHTACLAPTGIEAKIRINKLRSLSANAL